MPGPGGMAEAPRPGGPGRRAIREYAENHSRAELLDSVLDEELPRCAEALERLGR